MRKACASTVNESEVPTQLVDLSTLSSETLNSNLSVEKETSNLSTSTSKAKAPESKPPNRAVKGEWMTKRSSSAKNDWMSKRSPSITNSRWSMGKNTKRKAVEDDIAARDAVEDELLLSTKLVEQGMSPITNLEFSDIYKNKSTENSYGSYNNSDDDESADISFKPIIANMSHSKGDRQTTLTQYVRSVEIPVYKKKIV